MNAKRASLADYLIIAVFAGNLVMITSIYIISHYYNFDAISSLGYVTNDGWCDTEVTGIAGHCFGDYSLLPHFIVEENPWNLNLFGPWNYPAASMLPAYIFYTLGVVFNSQFVGLICYLVAMAISISIPGIWAVRKVRATFAIPIAAVFGCLSVPAMMALDRGNSVGFAVPVFLWFLISLGRDKYWQTSISILILTMIKPQFVLLILVLILFGKLKEFFVTFTAIAGVSIAAFAIWPRDFPGTIIQAFHNTISYTTGVSMTSVWPSNASLTKGIYWWELGFRQFLGKETIDTWTDGHQGLAAGIFICFTLVLLFIVRKSIGKIGAGIVLIALASMSTPISWSYYLVFAVPVAAILIRDPLYPNTRTGKFRGYFDRPNESLLSKISQAILIFALVVTLTRFLLPVLIPNTGNNVVYTTSELVPAVWVAAISCYLIANLRLPKITRSES